MFETIQTVLQKGITIDPLALVISVLALLFLFMLWRGTKDESLDWKDMITSKGSNKVSLTKVLQLVGGVTGTWVMVYMTLKLQMTAEVLFTYLAYVGAIEGWSKFVAAKYSSGIPGEDPRNGIRYPREYGQYGGLSRYPRDVYAQDPYNAPHRPMEGAPPEAVKPPTGDDVN